MGFEKFSKITKVLFNLHKGYIFSYDENAKKDGILENYMQQLYTGIYT